MQFDKSMFLLKKTINDLKIKICENIILLLGPDLNKQLFNKLDVEQIIFRQNI